MSLQVAAQSLQASAGAKAAAEAFAEEAGLRAAAAMGRAEKLDMEVSGHVLGRTGGLLSKFWCIGLPKSKMDP